MYPFGVLNGMPQCRRACVIAMFAGVCTVLAEGKQSCPCAVTVENPELWGRTVRCCGICIFLAVCYALHFTCEVNYFLTSVPKLDSSLSGDI